MSIRSNFFGSPSEWHASRFKQIAVGQNLGDIGGISHLETQEWIAGGCLKCPLVAGSGLSIL